MLHSTFAVKLINMKYILLAFLSIIFSEDSYSVEGKKYLKGNIPISLEPSLNELSKDIEKEVYQFYWERSFDDTMVFRVDISSPKISTITIKKFSKERPKNIIKNEVFLLTKTHLKNFKRFLKGSQFWNLSSENGSGGLDGATWILEGIKNGKYHYTKRWSPLPPYFGWRVKMNGKKIVLERENPPLEQQVKHSDEVGLDFLCLYITLMVNHGVEEIY